MPIENNDQAKDLARIIHHIRPDWPEQSFYQVALKELRKGNPLMGRPFADIVVAATTKATNPTIKSPAPIWLPGPHWPAYDSEEFDAEDFIPDNPCEDHRTENATTCRSCKGDINAGDRPPAYLGRHYNPDTMKDAA